MKTTAAAAPLATSASPRQRRLFFSEKLFKKFKRPSPGGPRRRSRFLALVAPLHVGAPGAPVERAAGDEEQVRQPVQVQPRLGGDRLGAAQRDHAALGA